MTVCLHLTHRQFGIGCGDVPLAPLASRLAAMPRGLRHSKHIWFGAAWRDARRCGRSRVGWVGGSEIGLEDPAQVGDLKGFVGVLLSPWEWLGGLEVMGEVGSGSRWSCVLQSPTLMAPTEMISRTSQMSVLR